MLRTLHAHPELPSVAGMVDPLPPSDAAALLESVLGPLLEDFATSFERGLTLLKA